MGLMAPEVVVEIIVRQYEDGRVTVDTAGQMSRQDRGMPTHAPRLRALLLGVAREMVGPEHLVA